MFVVGAGASVDAGLPVGAKLKLDISQALHFKSVGDFMNEKLLGDTWIQNAIQHLCLNEKKNLAKRQDYYDAAAQISESMRLAKSIDHYLHSHRGNEFIETCGKLAIARTILLAERASKLYVSQDNTRNRLDLGKLDGTWYMPFAELLCSCALDELPERLSRIQFIVFNYDRCIEQFLIWAFQIYFSLSESQAGELVNQVEIWHPYGKVGRLPWQSGTGYAVDFGSERYDLSIVAKQLRTFTESTDPDESEVRSLRRALNASDTVLFLGCGYHELNLQLIQPTGGAMIDDDRIVYGTAKGLTEHNRLVAKSRLEGLWSSTPSGGVHILTDVDCVNLFREFYFSLDQ